MLVSVMVVAVRFLVYQDVPVKDSNHDLVCVAQASHHKVSSEVERCVAVRMGVRVYGLTTYYNL